MAVLFQLPSCHLYPAEGRESNQYVGNSAGAEVWRLSRQGVFSDYHIDLQEMSFQAQTGRLETAAKRGNLEESVEIGLVYFIREVQRIAEAA